MANSSTDRWNSSHVRNLTAQDSFSVQIACNIVWAILCAVGFLLSLMQLRLMFVWKPLRQTQQILVVAVICSDACKSFAFGVICLKRLYFTARGEGELISQLHCMFWLSGIILTSWFSLFTILALSVERAIGMLLPVWYRCKRVKLKTALAILAAISSFAAWAPLFVGVDSRTLRAQCTAVASPTLMYDRFFVHFQNVLIGLIILLNVTTLICVVRRWRHAPESDGADVHLINASLELQASKIMFGLVCVFLVTFFAGTLFQTIVDNWENTTKAKFGPLVGTIFLSRGVLDFFVYIVFNEEYRKGFVHVFCDCRARNREDYEAVRNRSMGVVMAQQRRRSSARPDSMI